MTSTAESSGEYVAYRTDGGRPLSWAFWPTPLHWGLYVPVVGLYLSIFSVLFLEIWYILVGLRLLRLGR